MKRSFHHNMVNGEFEDPCLYVRLQHERRALLMDAGDLHALGQSEILKVTDLFLTHMHIDHFIGFDTLMRVMLGREALLRVFGPEGVIACVEGKLRGYSWNLIRNYPVRFEVSEIHGGRVRRATFAAPEEFVRRNLPDEEFTGVVLEDEMFRVRALPLTHGLPSLAYSVEEDYHINIDKAALEERGLPVGQWLADLKAAIRSGAPGGTVINAGGTPATLESLREITRTTDGQRVVYVADTSPTPENIARITEFARGATTLYLEAYFLDEDRERAMERHHLTGLVAGRIAREAWVGRLVPTHFSPKYKGLERLPGHEALDAFSGLAL